MNVIDILRTHGVEPALASSSKGGEWHGPCPGCGGSDRFHVWPEQNEGAGSYWCRKCGKGGDGIQFLIDFEGCGFREACERLGVDQQLITARPFSPPDDKQHGRRAWEPRQYEQPADLWQQKAEQFVLWSHAKLIGNDEQMAVLAARGIGPASVERFKLGWNPGREGKDLFRPRASWGVPDEYKPDGKKKKLWLPRGLVIPRIDADGNVTRIRVRRPKGGYPETPKYYVIPGSSGEPMVIGVDRDAFVIVEAELDAMAVFEAAGDIVGAVAMGSSSTRPGVETAKILESALVILDALDYDGAGGKERDWWREYFPATDRWPVPAGKDPGEAFAAGVDLKEWILEGLPPRFKVSSATPKARQNEAGGASDAGTPGPSRLDSGVDFSGERGGDGDAAAGAVVTDRQVWQTPCAPEGCPEATAAMPVSVFDLAQLMYRHPVAIDTSPERLRIAHKPEWSSRNWELLSRISNAVYFDPEIFHFICSLPAGRYKGRDLLELYSAGNDQAAANA